MSNINKKSYDCDVESISSDTSEDDPAYNPVRKRRRSNSSEEDSDVEIIAIIPKVKRNTCPSSSKVHDVSQTSKLQEATLATCSGTTSQRGTNKENQMCEISIPEESNDGDLWGKFLPDIALEIIFKIVIEEEGHVPGLLRMGQVCHTWRKASERSFLWHTADINGLKINKRYKNTKFLTWLCEHRLSGVRNLNIGDWRGINIQEALDAVCTFCTNLQSLSLSGWYDLKPAHIFETVRRCANLTSLDLLRISCHGRYNPIISVESINVLTSLMGDRLTSLDLSYNEVRVTISSLLDAISANAPNLEVLNLSNVDTSRSKFPIVKLQEKCQKLRVLRLSVTLVEITVPEAHQLVPEIAFPNLEELSIAFTHSYVDNNVIYGILHKSYNLRLLEIRGTSVTVSGILNIPANNLKYIYLCGSKAVTQADSNLKSVLEKWCHSLVYIDLSLTESPLALKQALEVFSDSGRNYPLKYLDLMGCTVELPTVQKVVKNCPNLTSLNLSSCLSMRYGLKRPYRTRQEISSLLDVTEELHFVDTGTGVIMYMNNSVTWLNN